MIPLNNNGIPNNGEANRNTDPGDLRDRVWDYLFQAKTSQSVADIAAHLQCSVSDVEAAVHHEWFRLASDRVAIAYGNG